MPTAIIGGGIAGLSTAWYLQQQGVTCHVIEQGARWGGKILTEQADGFVIEAGPDSFLTQKPWALQLARELGLEPQGTNDQMRNVFVLQRGRPVMLPEGVMLIVPTKFRPFALSPLISPLGKLRMACDLFIPPRSGDDDETLADFVRRRLGSEALDKIAEPLMSGIYNAEADRQSLLATFPRFRDIERKHGSLIRGMLTARQAAPPTTGPKLSAFVSFAHGTQTLIEALVPRLSADLRLNTGVERITPQPDGGYHLALSDGATLTAESVVLATPAYVTAGLVRPFAPEAAHLLDTIRYVSTGTISLAFRAADLPRPLAGFGVVIPASEQRPINALTIASTKFDERAPVDHVLIRVFFGGSRSPQSMELDDDALLALVRDQLRAILGIEAAPLLHRIYRWWRANPQYDLGHLERVAQIEAALPPGLYLTGSAYRGVGIPDCVHQAQQTATIVTAQQKVTT